MRCFLLLLMAFAPATGRPENRTDTRPQQDLAVWYAARGRSEMADGNGTGATSNQAGTGGIDTGLNEALRHQCPPTADPVAASRARSEAARRFRWAEFIFRNADFRFRQPSTFKADFDRMRRDTMRATAAYMAVIEAGDPELTVASLYRTAQLPNRFANALLTAPVPRSVDESQDHFPCTPVENKAYEFEEPTLETLDLVLSFATRCGVENAWTAHARRLRTSLQQACGSPPGDYENESGGIRPDPAAP